MGEFGGEHRDELDSVGHYTTMTSLSRLPASYDPGRFFILYPGVYVTLNDYATVSFSGLRRHGGTAPYAPEGADDAEFESAVRFAVINYPPQRQTGGNQRYALGTLPKGKMLDVPPEMTFTS